MHDLYGLELFDSGVSLNPDNNYTNIWGKAFSDFSAEAVYGSLDAIYGPLLTSCYKECFNKMPSQILMDNHYKSSGEVFPYKQSQENQLIYQITKSSFHCAQMVSPCIGSGKGPPQLVMAQRALNSVVPTSIWSYALGPIGGFFSSVLNKTTFEDPSSNGKQCATDKSSSSHIEKDINNWLGKKSRKINNKAGDLIILSENGKRRVRFDFIKPHPHNNKHMHVEELIQGEWMGSGQIYPIDVPHN